MINKLAIGALLLLPIFVNAETVTVEVHVTFVDVAATSEDPLNDPINHKAEPNRPVTVVTEETPEGDVDVTVVYQ